VYLPPLRNRREDIPRLIDYFLDKYNAVNDRRLRRISRDMLNVLLRYPWPGTCASWRTRSSARWC
jgi:transcriptional regulator with PAS, ATPase and Fis domain